jgi:hypothetical protein
MPILKFTNDDKEKHIRVRGKSTIRIVNALFSKGFVNSENMNMELSFSGMPANYILSFESLAIIRDPRQSGLFFYQGNGAVFAVPLNSGELILRASALRNFDFEFVLTYDFYPGSI